MSLEVALDEDRREVMEILEGRLARPPSPTVASPASPASPIRSMLDVDPAPRDGSAAMSRGLAPSSPKIQIVRNMLDPQSPSSVRTAASDAPSTPHGANEPSRQAPRRYPESCRQSIHGLPRIDTRQQRVDLERDYRFEMLPSIANPARSKRASLSGRTQTSLDAGLDSRRFTSFSRSRRDSGPHSPRSPTAAGLKVATAKSGPASSTLGTPSESPGNRRLLNPTTSSARSPMSSPKTLVTDHGKLIRMDRAYRRLSDAMISKSGGSLGDILSRSKQRRESLNSGESMSPAGDVRLDKDYFPNPDEEEGVEESSEEDDEHEDSSDDESPRGRNRSRGKKTSISFADDKESDQDEPEEGADTAAKSDTAGSLLAAAEEERIRVAFSQPVRFGPEVTVTGPRDERMVTKKKTVHPYTSYDHTMSGLNSPASSDTDAELSDIKRAQHLSLNLSPIDASVPNRVIRTIVRGDFAKVQSEADEGNRRQRLYFVAIDLSEEAVYALEWTIGTILRDGDTMFAVYAVDEEVGLGKTNEIDPSHSVQIGEGAKAMEEATAVLGSLTEKATKNAAHAHITPTSYMPATAAAGSRTGSVDARQMSKAEQERYHAIEDITQTCLRLLRKTRLQVRVAVEVVHCKSPKHMITEAIDSIEPTLVILGSRGRSSLKGVLLGSFSNYLVAKSSVPVMVARKKLKKHAKARIRLSNNLNTTSSSTRLAWAKID